MMVSAASSRGPSLADLSDPRIAESVLAEFLKNLRAEHERAEEARQHALDQALQRASAMLISTVAAIEGQINAAREDVAARGAEAAKLLADAKANEMQTKIYRQRVVEILKS